MAIPPAHVLKLTHFRPGNGARQDGTASDDEWEGVATGIDGTSAILVGYTGGDWKRTGQAGKLYFAAIELDADNATLWTYQVSVKCVFSLAHWSVDGSVDGSVN